jgi:hypothetical protein
MRGDLFGCCEKYTRAYGSAIWWQIALGGLLGGAATGGMDG